MNDYMLLMHDDPTKEPADAEWEAYFGMLSASGAFQGGSSIGAGATYSQGGAAGPLSARLTGFIRVTARDLTDAQRFLKGNPVYVNGGTVEIRELPRD